MSELRRTAILGVLRAVQGEWVSGEELSRSLGVSRAAIWKQVENLREAGYMIEAQTRMGYRLISAPDAVSAREIEAGLTTRSFGHKIEYRQRVGSTNELAKQLARAGAPEGLLVIAEEQTAGKGRLGRTWVTPPGSSLAMTLILRPPWPPYHASRLTLAAAVAVAEAVREALGLDVRIKWPNDLQIHGRKVSGILTEMDAELDRVNFLVCGIGLNVNLAREQIPAEFAETATSVLAELGRPVERAMLVCAILARFERVYNEVLDGGFERVLDRWRSLSSILGKPVRVLSAAGIPVLSGIAEDVDGDGALLVRGGDGKLQRALAGEVSLRPE